MVDFDEAPDGVQISGRGNGTEIGPDEKTSGAKRTGLGTRLAHFFIPIMISAAWISVLWLALPQDYFLIIGALILAYFISPFGREVLIPTAIIAWRMATDSGSILSQAGGGEIVREAALGNPILQLALIASSVVFVDSMCSLFLIWNIDLLKKVPKLGGLITGFERAGLALIEKRGNKQLATLGLMGYVSLPFQGSGGISSTIIGLIAGIPRRNVLVAVVVGSTIGSVLVAAAGLYIADSMLDIFKTTLYYISGLTILVIVLIFVIRRYWLHRRDYKL